MCLWLSETNKERKPYVELIPPIFSESLMTFNLHEIYVTSILFSLELYFCEFLLKRQHHQFLISSISTILGTFFQPSPLNLKFYAFIFEKQALEHKTIFINLDDTHTMSIRNRQPKS